MRELRPKGRKNCCVAVALSFVTGRSFNEVDEWLLRRSPRYRKSKGVAINQTFPKNRELLGIKMVRVLKNDSRWIRIAHLRRRFPKGTFLVSTTGHMYVFKGGQVYDYLKSRPNEVIRRVWEVRR